MKIYERVFKARDVVRAPNDQEAALVDWSDACDGMEVDYVNEIDADEYKRRWAKNWSEFIPTGCNDDYLTLAELFAADTEGKS